MPDSKFEEILEEIQKLPYDKKLLLLDAVVKSLRTHDPYAGQSHPAEKNITED